LDHDAVAVAAKQRVGCDMHLDQGVAGGAAAKAGPALSPQPQDLTVDDSGRYCHVEPFFRGQRQAFLPAGRRLGKVDGEGEEAVTATRPEALAAASLPPAPGGAKGGEQILEIAQIQLPFGLVFSPL